MSSPDDRLIFTRGNLQALVDKIKAEISGPTTGDVIVVDQNATVNFTSNTLVKVNNLATVTLGTAANEGTKVTVINITSTTSTATVIYGNESLALQPNTPVNFMYINSAWVCNSFAVWA